MSGWGAWNASWEWALALIPITVAIHVSGIAGIAFVARWNRSTGPHVPVQHAFTAVVATIAGIGLVLAVLHALECGVWAIAYMKLGALPSPADALLYSVDSMTTRGESGLQLTSNWRMLGAIEALDGTLLFGISTAFLFAAMARFWRYHTQTN